MSERYILVMKRVPSEDFTPLEPEFKVIYMDSPEAVDRSRLYSDILPQTEAIIATAGVSSELIAKALKLKVIVINGAGYDDVDISAASALHVPVYNIPDLTASATAELALTLMLAVSRRVNELNLKLRSDPAHAADLFRIGINPGHSLHGKTLGIIGMGNIGTRLARMASAIGMNVIYTQRHQLPIGLERSVRYYYFKDLLAASDEYAALLSRQIEERFTNLLRIGVLLLLGGIAGFLQIPSAFEKNKSRFWLIAPVLLCLGCAVAAEILCRIYGRGDSYSALASASFALIQLALVIPKKKS